MLKWGPKIWDPSIWQWYRCAGPHDIWDPSAAVVCRCVNEYMMDWELLGWTNMQGGPSKC